MSEPKWTAGPYKIEHVMYFADLSGLEAGTFEISKPDECENWLGQTLTIEQAQLFATAPKLYTALESAIQTIRTWHGINLLMDPQTESQAWELYFNHAPEMKVLREALAEAVGEKITPPTRMLPPVVNCDAHPFQPVPGNRYCGKCGAEEFHPIHTRMSFRERFELYTEPV